MNIVIAGGSGGIGGALVARLAQQPNVQHIIATYRRSRPEADLPKVTWQPLDLSDEGAIREWAGQIDEIDWLVNAAGMLHTPAKGPEKTIRHIEPGFFLENMGVNTLPTLLLAKHLHNQFRHGRPAVFATVSAKVGSIEDNHLGGWFSYRASKAALNMCLKTLAIEWRRTLPNVAVAALHPGTTDTALSRPFQANVPPEQLFAPGKTADYLVKVLEGLQPGTSAQFLAFDGEALPW
jgi:NAD(P)-dependent dehydrogenase (short-subunit alcohol dehydrogenase family)